VVNIGCREIVALRGREVPHCCTSCHEDAEDELYAMELMHIEGDEARGVWSDICCSVCWYLLDHPLTEAEWGGLV
jgi:hypothetical protein